MFRGVGGTVLLQDKRKMYDAQMTIFTYYSHACIYSATAIKIGGDSANSNIKGLFHRSKINIGPFSFVLINNTLGSKCMCNMK